MEYQIPLGRTIKIANVLAQRRHLMQKLKEAYSPCKDATIQYIGHIFPENIEWLKEMHDIDVFKTRITDGKENGKELNILTPSDVITLSDTEMEISLKILEKGLSEDRPCGKCTKHNCIACVGEFDNLIHELYNHADCTDESENIEEGFTVSCPEEITKELEEKFENFFTSLNLEPGKSLTMNENQSTEFANLIEEAFGVNVFELEADAHKSIYEDDYSDDDLICDDDCEHIDDKICDNDCNYCKCDDTVSDDSDSDEDDGHMPKPYEV